MKFASVASAMPPHYYDQATVTARLERIWADHPEITRRLAVLHGNCGVDGRHFALPIDRYEELEGFGDFNDAWIEVALELGEARDHDGARTRGPPGAGRRRDLLLERHGIAAPSIDARLMNRMPFRADLRRTPIFGLGCVAGAAACSRATDFLRGRPDGVALVLTVELCSLTWQPRRHFARARALDGTVRRRRDLRGARRSQARRRGPGDPRHAFGLLPRHRGGHGLARSRARLLDRARADRARDGARAPRARRRRVPREPLALAQGHRFLGVPPGGPKVLAAARDSLGLTDDDVALAWDSLRTAGNLSSASVLLILERTLERRRPRRVPGRDARDGPGLLLRALAASRLSATTTASTTR
jgi:alkylresorcinol/alkylpyrone synthase